MQPPVDVTKLGAPAQRILDPKAPAALRQLAAKGIAPGLKPADAVSVLALLAASQDAVAAAAAIATLDKLPAPLLNGALNAELQPGVIDVLAPRFAKNETVMERILALPQIALETVATVAAIASEAVAELIATNEERLLRAPSIIERLYLNKMTRMSTADRMVELAVRNKIELTGIPAFKEAAAAIRDNLIAEPTREPNPEDVQFKQTMALGEQISIDPEKEDTHEIDESTGEEVVRKKVLPLHARIAEMSTSQKIRLSQIGQPAERMILLRDNDRRVAEAAIKSSGIQVAEVEMVTQSRSTSDGVLRYIAARRDWFQKHKIKTNLVMNPRCPFEVAVRVIPFLRDSDLRSVARNKNVAGAVAEAAKRQLERKGVKS
jgi:hypothetical protein